MKFALTMILTVAFATPLMAFEPLRLPGRIISLLRPAEPVVVSAEPVLYEGPILVGSRQRPLRPLPVGDVVFHQDLTARGPVIPPRAGVAWVDESAGVAEGSQIAEGGEVVEGRLVMLYPNVLVKDLHRIHPCAIPQVVEVPNPCPGMCEPVYVQICVPPCAYPCIEITKHGQRTNYNFGDYRVQVTSRKGFVKIDYDN